MTMVRFRFAPQKALAAIHWMIGEVPGLDLHTLMKAVYFADKAHLNKYGRPIFGASYRAMKYGPVPVEIYEMAKGEPLWLAELERQQFPWQLMGYKLAPTSNETPDTGVLSESDMAELKDGLRLSSSMTFNSRTAATHGSDWQRAELGWMHYEDMLDDTDDKEDRVAYLRETAQYARL